jgi:hypothetical protein
MAELEKAAIDPADVTVLVRRSERTPLSDVVWIDRWHARDTADSLLGCL